MVDLMFPAHIYIGSLSEPGTAEFILGESWIEAGIPFNMEWASSHNTTSENDAVPCASVFPHDITVCTESKKNANRKKKQTKATSEIPGAFGNDNGTALQGRSQKYKLGASSFACSEPRF